jgi:GTP-sensing pleiotropic transcriptional regulator CodY
MNLKPIPMKIIVQLCDTLYNVADVKTEFKDAIYSEENEALYYEVDIPFMPIEGQRLGTKFGMLVVGWSYYNIDGDDDSVSYFEKTRIVVEHEK